MTYDAMLVLGAWLDENGRPTSILRSRLDAAYAAYGKGLAEKVILCGGDTDEGFNEALSMKEYLLQSGMSERDIHLEMRSRTTRENLLHSRPLLLSLGAKTVLVVTSGFHAFRTKYYAKQLGMSIDVLKAHGRPNFILLKNISREFLAMLITLYRFPNRRGKPYKGRYYKKVELKGSEDVNSQVFRGRHAEPAAQADKIASKNLLGGSGGLVEMTLQKGARLAKPADRILTYYVISGLAVFATESGEVQLGAGDSIRYAAGAQIAIQCGCKDTMILEIS